MNRKYLKMGFDYLRGRFFFSSTFITSDCTCKCIMCNFWRMEKAYMSRDLFIKTLDVLSELGANTTSLTGGEPMKHPLFYEFVKLASRRGFYVTCSTNGTLLSKKNVQKMKESGMDEVYVSVDSLDTKISSWIRGFPSHVNFALKGVELLRKNGISRNVHVLLGRHNLHSFPNIVIHLSENYDTSTVLVFPDVGVGPLDETFEGAPNFDFTPQEITCLVDELISLKKHGYLVNNSIQYLTDIKRAYLGKERLIPCLAGKYYVNIYWDGRVTPCFKIQNSIPIDELQQEHLQSIPGCYDCLLTCFFEMSFISDCIKKRKYLTALRTHTFKELF